MERSDSETEIFSDWRPMWEKFNENNASERENGEIEFPLSDELLCEIILKYVPMYRWSSCLEYVSKQFQRCVVIAYQRNTPINIPMLFPVKLNKEIFPGKRSRKLSINWLNEILEKLLLVCPFLMELTGFDTVTRELSVANLDILKKFHWLRAINFEDLLIRPSCMSNFPSNWKSLKILNFSDCHLQGLNYSGPFPLNITSMESVALYNGGECNEKIYDHYPMDKDLWRELKSSGLEEISYLQNYGETLTTLKLSNVQVLFVETCGNAELFANKCPNLQSLTTYLYEEKDFEFLVNVLPYLHKLTDLNLSTNTVEGPLSSSFIHDLCVSMTSLANRLESFEIEANGDCRELQTFLFSKCLRLRCLKLHIIGILNNFYDIPRLSDSLEKLTIYHMDPTATVRSQTSIILQNVLQLSNLTHLNFDGSTDDPWQDIQNLENLRYLELPGDVITDHILQAWDTNVTGMFEQLVSLKINSCREISDIGACLLAKKSKNLEVLEMRWSRVSDVTILMLANSAKKLKLVNFEQEEPRLIECEAILKLIEKSVYLKKLTVAKALAIKLVENKDFLPFVDDVEIDFH